MTKTYEPGTLPIPRRPLADLAALPNEGPVSWRCPRCGTERTARDTFGVSPERVRELLEMNHNRKCPQGVSS